MAQQIVVDESTRTTPDFDAIKQRQQKMWGSGDYAMIGVTILYMSEVLVEAMQLHAGSRVLDVATGNGNAALGAARRLCDVVGVDYVPSLLEQARRRAEAEGLSVMFQEGDAEALPFPDASFDVVLSTVGVMFAPDQQRTADELVRVCRPGGRIGVINWTPDSLTGQLLRLVGSYVPPPAGLSPPTRWGTEAGLRELFGDRVTMQLTQREQVFRHRSPQHFVEFFRTYYGPTERAFATIETAEADRLYADFIALIERCNTATDGTVVAPSTYLEMIATRT